MSYNPVAAENAAAIKAEALAYSALYAKQGAKHVQYSWILWVAIAATVIVLTGWRLAKRLKLTKPAAAKIARTLNRTTLFGFDIRISRLQLILISFYTLYNIIFTFADIPYGRSYRYTSKHAPGFVQLATTIQFIANRTGFLAFASTPLVFLLVSRYNIITLLTGVSYQHLNLLHRCAGWMVFALSWIHTLLWTIEMGVNYHNEEGYLATRWQKRYWLGGFFATLFLSFITLHSLAFVRRYTGYEFFRITHNLGSVLFLIGCWVHWPVTFQWLAAALALYYSDRFMRWGRLAFHYARARGRTLLHGQAFHDEDGVSVASVEITNSGLISWTAGQHVYLYCISLSEWEPHPFSVANCGRSGEALNLIIRGKEGMTSELLNRLYENKDPIKVLVDGPYGSLDSNLLDGRPLLIAVAGTGISFGLSVLHTLARSPRESPQQIRLVWYIRRNANIEWASEDLQHLKSYFGSSLSIEIIISREQTMSLAEDDQFATGESIEKPSGSTSLSRGSFIQRCRDDSSSVPNVIKAFTSEHDKRTKLGVLGCGPTSFGDSIRRSVDHSDADIDCIIDQYNL